MKNIKVMKQSKSTPGTVVYKNDDDDAACKSIYINKSALTLDPATNAFPAEITLTVETS